MKVFKDKVAVITGAASGIGRGLAIKCADLGMKIVLADIDATRLRRIERKLKRQGVSVLSSKTDVSKAGDIEELAKKTIDTFGEVNLLFNNAGVAIPKLTWEYDLEDWEFVLGINLMGVIYGIRTFIPIMIKQDCECHVINISSIEGVLYNGVGGATYGVAKHALVFLSERLVMELEEIDPKIKISVVCPGFVKTNIFMASLNRLPDEIRDNFFQSEIDEEKMKAIQQFLEESPGITPEEVADIIFQGIRKDQLHIFTHKQLVLKEALQERFNTILKAFD